MKSKSILISQEMHTKFIPLLAFFKHQRRTVAKILLGIQINAFLGSMETQVMIFATIF
jgi:hypothetical protein